MALYCSEVCSYTWTRPVIHYTCAACRTIYCNEICFKYVTWLIHMCDMTHSHTWIRHSIHYTACRTIYCNEVCLCTWHNSFICATWLIHMSDMTHSYVRHDAFLRIVVQPVSEQMTRNSRRNAKRNPHRNQETIVPGLFSFQNLKRDLEQ